MKKIGCGAFSLCRSLSALSFAEKKGWFYAPPPGYNRTEIEPSLLSAENFSREDGIFFSEPVERDF